MGIKERIEERMNETIEEQSEEQTEVESHAEEETYEPQEGEWQPNYTYNVRKQDHEFDDWIRPAITSPEMEENIRELYTRAKGIDHVKAHLKEEQDRIAVLENDSENYRREAELAKQGIEGMTKLAKDDFASFAHLAGIDDQTILNYANARLDYKEKPEYERQQIDQDMDRRTQSYSQNLEVDNLRRQNRQLMQEQHNVKMQTAMSNPEIAQFQQAFDERMGEGAFRQHVDSYGSQQYRTAQQYVEPNIAVQHIYSQFKPLFIDKLDAINEGTKKKVTKPPTNLGTGRTSSVVTKRVKRLDDLRKRANELAKAEGYGGNYA